MDTPYGNFTSEGQIEREVERRTDRLDARFMANELSQGEYDAEIQALDRWAENQYRQFANL